MSRTAPSKSKKSTTNGIVLPPRPAIYEINTRVWLRELSWLYGEAITLANVPAEVWDGLAGFRFDAVWLMGVWERSPAGLAMALQSDSLLQEISASLPDAKEEDIGGSPFCVRAYEVDDLMGGRAGLAAARVRWPRGAWASSSTLFPTMSPPTTNGSSNTLSTSFRARPKTWRARRVNFSRRAAL